MTVPREHDLDRPPDNGPPLPEATRNTHRPRRLGIGALIFVSATLFVFSVAGIARVGASSEPSAPVVSAARDALREDAYPRTPDWGADAFLEARPDRRIPCRKRDKRPRVKS